MTVNFAHCFILDYTSEAGHQTELFLVNVLLKSLKYKPADTIRFVLNCMAKQFSTNLLTRHDRGLFSDQNHNVVSSFCKVDVKIVMPLLQLSPEEELTRSTKTDVIVFVASYVVIFIYITVALGTYTSCRRIPVSML